MSVLDVICWLVGFAIVGFIVGHAMWKRFRRPKMRNRLSGEALDRHAFVLCNTKRRLGESDDDLRVRMSTIIRGIR